MGRAAAVSDDVSFQPVFRQARQYRVRRAALPDFLLQRATALDVFRRRTPEFHEHYRRKSAPDNKGLFSAAGVATFLRAVRTGGFWRVVLDVRRANDLLRDTSHVCHGLVSRIPVAGDLYRAGRGAVAFRVERHLSRRALRNALPGPVLAIRFSGCVSKLTSAGEVALALRTKSNGWSDRRVSLVADGARESARTSSLHFLDHGGDRTFERRSVFSKNGNNHGGCGVGND